jgi:SAM-dependent methyltransferase
VTFDPYQQLSLHRWMLRDHVRNEAYRRAIAEVVKQGDIVLDMGAGTGILSLLAVTAGARRVYAVERTRIAEVARRMVKKNGAEDRVRIIEEDMETVVLPEKVDVIVSEWLGGFGVDENLLAPLLMTRDRWLKPSGKILPERVTAWLAPAWDGELDEYMRFWRSRPHGIDMSAVADNTAQELLLCRNHIRDEDLLADPRQMWTTDVYACPAEEADRPFQASLTFSASRDGKLSGLATWFQADFFGGHTLTNAPGTPETHWGRYVFPLDRTVKVDKGTTIEVDFACYPSVPGCCEMGWSVKVGNRPLEHHDTGKGYV